MDISVFLSHTKKDKVFVRKLAQDLDSHGVTVWIDEAEIKVGDSLIKKIRSGIDNVDYVAVVISPDSVESPWVQREVDVAMTLEINGEGIKVLPILYKDCGLPGFLLGKFYADFTKEEAYAESLAILVKSMGIAFNKTVLGEDYSIPSLGAALDRAIGFNLPMLVSPYHRPFQYIGENATEVAKKLITEPNSGGNIILENEICSMCLEVEGGFVSYVEVELKQTAPCRQDCEFDSEALLGCMSINPSELDLDRKQIHCHVYYDHKRKLKISVACSYDDGPMSVSFGTKYYKM